MRITATVKVDLSEFVFSGLLYMGDREVRHLHRCGPFESPLTVEVNIGEARLVQWSVRAVDELLSAQQVLIVGSNPAGVREALASLQAQFEERAA